ncbi:MAG: TatD family deoxyribonuclease [Chloroflexi bacterium]|nr:TatD family deoxyribonuclease [Chloroflexota bacterium]MQC47640.1 TatD family deoxyribonuclease [Chloroflexota bacterium]
MSKKKIAPPPRPLPGVVDAHAHVTSREMDEDRDEMLARAWATGLRAVIEVGCSPRSAFAARDLARQHEHVHAVAGLHPHSASELGEVREAFEAAFEEGGYVGIGETGLDFYRNLSPPEDQYAAFWWQLDLARQHELPVVIHSRNADEDCFEVIREWSRQVGPYLGADREIGMMHCFSGDLELAQRYIDIGFVISIPGPVTYPGNDQGQEVARSIPLERMLVETDCPHLTPVPWRGRRNEPAYVAETARFVAGLRGIDASEVARQAAENTARLFNITLAPLIEAPLIEAPLIEAPLIEAPPPETV